VGGGGLDSTVRGGEVSDDGGRGLDSMVRGEEVSGNGGTIAGAMQAVRHRLARRQFTMGDEGGEVEVRI
jgi:hypothetical protein